MSGPKEITEIPPQKVSVVMESFRNENRIKILQILLKGSMISTELSKDTYLEGGQLYHHLKELMFAGYIEAVDRARYGLTPRGAEATRIVAAVALTPGLVIPSVDQMEEDLKKNQG